MTQEHAPAKIINLELNIATTVKKNNQKVHTANNTIIMKTVQIVKYGIAILNYSNNKR